MGCEILMEGECIRVDLKENFLLSIQIIGNILFLEVMRDEKMC